MPDAGSSFEIVTPSKSKKGGKGIIIALVVVLFLALGIFAGVILVRQRQDIREKAANTCPAAESCTGTQLRNCTPPEGDNSPADSNCNAAGRIESCGGAQYCCPAAGGNWTTNMAACATPTPSPTPSPTPTVSPTPTSSASSTPGSTKTPTPTPTKTSASSTASAAPIPQTGTGWPTYVGAGLGILVIVGSLLLAL